MSKTQTIKIEAVLRVTRLFRSIVKINKLW